MPRGIHFSLGDQSVAPVFDLADSWNKLFVSDHLDLYCPVSTESVGGHSHAPQAYLLDA